MEFKDLTPEQMEKAKACRTPEDILTLVKEEGYDLSDEELAALGGSEEWYEPCLSYVREHCSVNYHPPV